MILSAATPADTPALAALGRDSFVAAFGDLYRPADLAAFVEEVYSERTVAKEIANTDCIHRLAWEGARLVGYCKLREPSWYAEHSDAARPIALGQLYTDAGHTGRGIGAALMEWAIDEACTRGCDAIQLSVFSENHGAQRFYERYGFGKIADIDFWVGNHRDDEYLYELRMGDRA